MNLVREYFCEKCGREMMRDRVGAENFINKDIEQPIFSSITNPAFDIRTGKRNYVMRVRCPELLKRRFFRNNNEHDSYGIGDVFQI